MDKNESNEDYDESDESSDSYSGDESGVKVPEAFQKKASSLVEECNSEACLNFVTDLCSEKRKQLMSSQKKSGNETANFSSENMPEMS
jgi:hypothetical protein